MAERNYPDLPRVYFDMDGVLADFEKESRDRNIPFSELKMTIDAYRHLPIMPGAKEAVQRAMAATPLLRNYSGFKTIFLNWTIKLLSLQIKVL